MCVMHLTSDEPNQQHQNNAALIPHLPSLKGRITMEMICTFLQAVAEYSLSLSVNNVIYVRLLPYVCALCKMSSDNQVLCCDLNSMRISDNKCEG